MGAFGNLSDVFKGNVSSVFSTVTVYGAETWSLSKQAIIKLQVTQRAMERVMLVISLCDHINNTEIKRTKLTDIASDCKEEMEVGRPHTSKNIR